MMRNQSKIQAVFLTEDDIKQLAARWMPDGWNVQSLRVHTDSSDFFKFGYGDILLLAGKPYLIRNSAREGRFGLDEDVKHWVKRAIDLVEGSLCIIKLVFHEKFTTWIGGIRVECYRSPIKEARILERVKDHPNFMHGTTIEDSAGNPVRVLDYIAGPSLVKHIEGLAVDHESYFHDFLPGLLDNYLNCLQAIRYLHELGEKHGDIRRDHILIDKNSGNYRWIDFDYNCKYHENMYAYDLFGLGNILIYIVGMGDVLLHSLQEQRPSLFKALDHSDMNIVFGNRLANLKKIYPYIPDSLNRILMHFSRAANWHYEHTSQLIEDLQNALLDVSSPKEANDGNKTARFQ
jgi:serine/threonine protein kinase